MAGRELELEVNGHLEERFDCIDSLNDLDIDEIICRNRSQFASRRLYYEAPEFLQRLNGFEEAEVGSDAIFECQCTGTPRPASSWFKDDEPIKESERIVIDRTAESTGLLRLVLKDVKQADEGAYKCKAENQEGIASTTGYLSVTAASSEKSRKSAGVVSAPPLLRSITEQKSLEEREEVEYSRLPPSPLQEFIENLPRSATWPYNQFLNGLQDNKDEDSDSDTSIETLGSQGQERLKVDFTADFVERKLPEAKKRNALQIPERANITRKSDETSETSSSSNRIDECKSKDTTEKLSSRDIVTNVKKQSMLTRQSAQYSDIAHQNTANQLPADNHTSMTSETLMDDIEPIIIFLLSWLEFPWLNFVALPPLLSLVSLSLSFSPVLLVCFALTISLIAIHVLNVSPA